MSNKITIEVGTVSLKKLREVLFIEMNMSYKQIAIGTGIPIDSLKSKFTGRRELTVNELNTILMAYNIKMSRIIKRNVVELY